jgi:CheY-like chemotaxis protein
VLQDSLPPIFNVLAIDDDSLILKIVHSACRPFDLRVTIQSADNVHSAINLSKKTRFDLLVLDHDLAGIKGWELYDYLKPQLNPKVQVVVFSGGVDEPSKHEYAKRGIDSIVKKPLNPSALGFYIRKSLGV